MDSHGIRPRWNWPTGTASRAASGAANAHAAGRDHAGPDPPGHANTAFPGSGPDPKQPPPRERHFKPRTCRICLEEVHPTVEVDTSVPSFLAAKPKVRYMSEDAELGRLICPCKCKGSQKYVHAGCLQAWRAAVSQSDCNYWSCPTCKFQYRLGRLRWANWLTSTLVRAGLTVLVFCFAVFLLGFIADPVISLWVDPVGSIMESILDVGDEPDDFRYENYLRPGGWTSHFTKGFFSLGLLGMIKTFLSTTPFHWIYMRVGGGNRRRRGVRLDDANIFYVMVGTFVFLAATWKLVSRLIARGLETASVHVMDVQSDEPDEDEDNTTGMDRPGEQRRDE